MRQRVIHVLTHDSIGLGEDGPTHQPVEHLASLRAIPNLHVFRPADAMETAECWELAVKRADGPRVLALSRQNLPTLPHRGRREPLRPRRLCAGRGRCRPAPRHADRHRLRGARWPWPRATRWRRRASRTAVVSLPCWELFAAAGRELPRPGAGRRACASASRPAVGFGWERWLGPDGHLHRHERLRRLGAGRGAFRHFGITPRRVAAAVEEAARLRNASTGKGRNDDHGREGRHQRVRAHRAPGAARHDRERPHRRGVRRHQRPRQRRGQRAPVPLRQRAWPLPRRGRPSRATPSPSPHHGRTCGPIKVTRRARPDQGAVPGRRRRAGMHRHLHQQGEGLARCSPPARARW